MGERRPCDTYWGSHGCRKRHGHRRGHWCSCCLCGGPLRHRLRARRSGCVARPPYYGPGTEFYGDDAPGATGWQGAYDTWTNDPGHPAWVPGWVANLLGLAATGAAHLRTLGRK